MVFFYHLRWATQPSDENPLPLMIGSFNFEHLLRKFDIGVAIFFVLSGLLLSMPFWRAILENKPAPDLGRYMWRRACRIVPAYFAVLIAVYLLRGDTYTFYGALDFLLHATFLHNFADFSYHSAHLDLWTIGIEFQFYLLLPVLMLGVGALYKKVGGAASILALIAVCFAADIAAVAVLGKLEPRIPDRFIAPGQMVVTGTVFSYLKLFAFGIAAAFAVLRTKISPRVADIVCAVGIFATVALIVLGDEAGWRKTAPFGWPLNALVLAIVAASLARSSFFARIFSAKWIAGTGTISYGMYLWHDLIQHAVYKGTLRGNLSGFPLFFSGGAIAMFITIVIATLSWHIIEKGTLRAAYPFTR
jgi:peptidoglycan/LPS O-acetylase OafA/YrhL